MLPCCDTKQADNNVLQRFEIPHSRSYGFLRIGKVWTTLRYESSTLILCKELSSPIFQSCEWVSPSGMRDTLPDLHLSFSIPLCHYVTTFHLSMILLISFEEWVYVWEKKEENVFLARTNNIYGSNILASASDIWDIMKINIVVPSLHCLSYVFSFLSYLRADEANETQKLIKPIMSIKSMGSTMPQGSGEHCTMYSLYSMFSF